MLYLLIRLAFILTFVYFIARFFGWVGPNAKSKKDQNSTNDNGTAKTEELKKCTKCDTYTSDLKSHECADKTDTPDKD